MYLASSDNKNAAVPAQTDERVVRVLPDVGALRKTFDYSVPPGLADGVRVGTQVRIALGARRVGGWVVEDHVDPTPGVAVRPIAAVRGWGPPPAVLELAIKHNLIPYDACYLALALDRKLPLATFDKRLAEAARREQVEILGPLAGP